jgi:hypothetical protein
LLALRRVSCDSALRHEVGRVTVAVVAIMWMEAIRNWTAALVVGLTGSHSPLVERAVWTIREILWLYLAREMVAIVMCHVAQSTMGRIVLKHWPLFRGLAPLQP